MPEIDIEEGEPSRKRKEVTPPQVVSKKLGYVEDPQLSEEDGREEVFPPLSGDTELGYIRSQFDELKRICAGMSSWASSQYKSKKLLVSQQNEILKSVEQMNPLIKNLETKMSYLQGRLDERTRIEELISSGPVRSDAPRYTTFAETVKIPKVTGMARVQTPKVLFVKSSDEKKSLEEVKNVIKTTIRPSQMGVNIRRVTKTARGVLIEAEGQDQLVKISECKALLDKGLIFDKPKKRNPRVMVYDVEVPEDMQELVEDVYQQNFRDSEIDIDTFKSEFHYVHRYRKKDPKDTRASLVIECSARIRNLVRSKDRLYIGWQSCRIKDYNPLVRCFKCQSYGHVAKYCKGKTNCSHCAEEHEFVQCPNKDKPPKCVNCAAAKKDPNHEMMSAKCPEYIRATKIAYERIDYGN